MDLYHSWIYRQVINTEWFMWIIVTLVLGMNLLLPAFVWYVMYRKRLADRNKS